jgi:hypothetical protein
MTLPIRIIVALASRRTKPTAKTVRLKFRLKRPSRPFIGIDALNNIRRIGGHGTGWKCKALRKDGIGFGRSLTGEHGRRWRHARSRLLGIAKVKVGFNAAHAVPSGSRAG